MSVLHLLRATRCIKIDLHSTATAMATGRNRRIETNVHGRMDGALVLSNSHNKRQAKCARIRIRRKKKVRSKKKGTKKKRLAIE